VEGFNQERRGLFDGLKVPFDVKAILLAAIGILVFLAGVWTIQAFWPLDSVAAERGLLCAVAGNVTSRLGHVGRVVANLFEIPNERVAIHTGTWVFFLLWCAFVWSFFAGAICRIAAMKIAREESMELKDAIKFGIGKFFPNLFSIAFVVAIIGFFYFVCNATIAGWLGRVPYIGDVLVGVLYFLVLLSSFFIVFTAALGILGFNLSAAAIATEASDTFDGVSRSWNYIIARPWHILLSYGVIGAYLALFLFFGNLFLKVSVKSLGIRWWGMSHEARVYKPAGELAKLIGGLDENKDEARLPGKAEYLYKRVLADKYVNMIPPTPGWTNDQVLYEQVIRDPKNPDVTRKEMRDVLPAIEGSLKFAEWMIWLWILFAQLMIYAYATAYFLSSQTTVCFLLRKEVEGDDYTEINLEEEEEEDEVEYADLGRTPAEPAKISGPAASAPAPAAKPLPMVAGGGEKKAEPTSGAGGGGHSHGPGEKHDH
jgi:hypothetical protein